MLWLINLLTFLLGAQLIPFSGSHVYPSTNVVNPTWTSVVESSGDARHYNQFQHPNLSDKQNLFLGSSQIGYKGSKQFTFSQGDNPQPSPEASVCQPLLRTVPLSERSVSSHHIMFHDRLTSRDSDCALSLLSSPQMQTSGISLSHHIVPQPSSLPLVQNHSLEPMESVLVTTSGRNANLPCHGMFPIVPDESSASATEPPQTIPFQWE